MTFSPILPLPLLLIMGFILLLTVGILCWKSGRSLNISKRLLLTLLYLIGITGVFALFLNPGRMEKAPITSNPIDILVLDTSASMAAPLDGANPGKSRMDEAVIRLNEWEKIKPKGVDVIYAGAGELWKEYDSPTHDSLHQAVEPASRMSLLLDSALRKYRMDGKHVRNVFLLSDGRDSTASFAHSLIQTANQTGTPIHTLALGGAWESPDLLLDIPRPLINAFPKNKINLTAKVFNKNLPDAQVGVTLIAPDGKEVDKKVITVPHNGESLISFSLDCPEKSSEYTITCDSVTGETRPDNNSQTVSVQVINAKIRVFLAEGSPYWDSKFLAQLLRNQPGFNVRSVHRLTNDRFYRINSGEDQSNAEKESGIPSTLQEFLQYDIIILGKGAEHILTPSAADALASFIKDHGGLLLFSRGKAYSGNFPQLQALEPFFWKSPLPGEFQITPSPEGVQDGLFGQALPGIYDPIWSSLPGLSDVWDIDRLQSFTRILARDNDNKTPLLAVRRIGMGAVAIINGDGLWKWDFFPEARRLGNWYGDFWSQFLPWIQTSSEFHPGYNLSLHVEKSEVTPDSTLNFELSWRGMSRPSQIKVELIPVGSETPEQATSPRFEGVKGGLPRWKGSLRLKQAGHYLLRASLPEMTYEPTPEVRVHILPPPTETDNLNANPSYLAKLSESTGGKFLTPTEWSAALPELARIPEEMISTENIFTPFWNKWWLLSLLVIIIGSVWFIRRRQGLL